MEEGNIGIPPVGRHQEVSGIMLEMHPVMTCTIMKTWWVRMLAGSWGAPSMLESTWLHGRTMGAVADVGCVDRWPWRTWFICPCSDSTEMLIRLVFILCGTYLTKNLAFWYKSYGFVDSIKFILAK
jgi:hypothetical protein